MHEEPDVDGAPVWPEIDVELYRRSRDWRWWVGLLGRVLVVTGLLLLAFVGYQLWGTGIQTRQAQNQLSSQFNDLLSTSTTSVAPSTSAVPAPSTADDSTVATSAPSSTTAVTTAPTAPPSTAPPPAPGDPIARLEAPKIGLSWIVVSGVGVDDLKKGPGHYPDTPLPGHIGNVGIAGHRTTFGHPFFRINELEPGDELILTTSSGRYVYKVTQQFIVAPSQSEVLAPTPDAELTLTSCHPRYSARQRIIIKAKLDPSQSSPIINAAPTTTAPPATTTPTSAPAASTNPGATTSSLPASSTASTTTSPRGRPTVGAATDQLDRGWFDDPSAWAPVVLWGLALTAIALLAWALKRGTRRRWIAVLAAALPFVVCLYFFFENVNRLLPPNI